MEERDLRLLEHTAIRNVTQMDYRVWAELKDTRIIGANELPDLNRLANILKIDEKQLLSGRSIGLIEDAVNNSDKVKAAVDRYAKIADANNIKVIGKGNKYYPHIWEYLSGMPPVLFVRGDCNTLRDLDVYGGCSIVGTRDPGRYALYATKEFSQKIGKKNIVIVSGMALGIDRMAHEACLDVGGRTIAVLPGGCDVIYPYQNYDIYERICGTGAVVSEMPPGQEVIKQYFPSRNRLISALSDVCLVMEAGQHSGTLHTASFAANQSRDVFVLPNSIYADNSIGGLELLRDGAEVLIDVDTVCERIRDSVLDRETEVTECIDGDDIEDLWERARYDSESLSEEDWKTLICDEISERPKNIDDICVSLGIPFSFLSALVTNLETEGRIANERGKYVLTIQGG